MGWCTGLGHGLLLAACQPRTGTQHRARFQLHLLLLLLLLFFLCMHILSFCLCALTACVLDQWNSLCRSPRCQLPHLVLPPPTVSCVNDATETASRICGTTVCRGLFAWRWQMLTNTRAVAVQSHSCATCWCRRCGAIDLCVWTRNSWWVW